VKKKLKTYRVDFEVSYMDHKFVQAFDADDAEEQVEGSRIHPCELGDDVTPEEQFVVAISLVRKKKRTKKAHARNVSVRGEGMSDLSKEMEAHFGSMVVTLRAMTLKDGNVHEYFHRLPGIDVKILVGPRDDRIWMSEINDPEHAPEMRVSEEKE